MSTRVAVACLATVMALSACASADSAATTTPPPTTLAPATTIDSTAPPAVETTTPARASTTTSTVATVGDGPLYLRPIDPTTLEDLDGSTLLGVGASMWSAVSPNRRWLAATGFATTEGDEPAALLVQLDEWGASDLRPMPAMTGLESLSVTDSGTMLWLSWAQSGWRLHRLEAGSNEPELMTVVDAGLVPLVDPDEMGVMTADYVAVVGQEDNDPFGGELRVLIVDLTDGEVAEVPLRGVWGGQVDDDDGDEIWRAESPGWAFDRDRELLYVVSATADEVVVVDLATAQIIRRDGFDDPDSLLQRVLEWWIPPADAKLGEGVRRNVALSPDGSRLYVATARAEYDGGRWQDVPLGVEVIDTDSLRVTGRSQLPINDVAVSPDGELVVGVGVEQRFAFGDDEAVGSGLYLLDAATLEVRHHVEDGAALTLDGFSSDASTVYAWSYHPVADVLTHVAVDAGTGQIVGNRSVSWPGYVMPGGAVVVDSQP